MLTGVRAGRLVLVLVVSAAIGGCGGNSGSAGTKVSAVEVRSDAARLYEHFAGSLRDRNAGLVLQAYRLNGGMDACLDRAGFPGWDWSAGRVHAQPEDALAETVWFAAPMSRPAKTVKSGGAPIGAAENAAVSTCLTAVPARSDGDESMPPAAATVRREWWDTLRAAGRTYGGDPAQYEACMKASGHPILDDRPDPAADGGAGTAADWACRSATYEKSIGNLAPVIATFARDHASQIKRAEQGWRKIEDEAAALGYTGQPGPLGT